MIDKRKIIILLIVNIFILIPLSIFCPHFSIYGFMVLELIGVIFVLYHELYSTRKSDIEKFNKELDYYCDYYIDRYETYNSHIYGRKINLPENKGLGISDFRKKLMQEDSDYKANSDRVLKNKETKKKNKIPYSHYTYYQTKAKHLLRYFLVPNSEPVNKGSISVYSGSIPPPAYPTLPEIPMLKNSILVLGYYLILNGFALQLLSQIFKDCSNKDYVRIESAAKKEISSNKEMIIDTFNVEKVNKDKNTNKLDKPPKIEESYKNENSVNGNKTSKY